MKAITKYVADDGREFRSEDECQRYEDQCEHVRLATAPLGEKPDLPACGFANGGGYLQHDHDTLLSVRRHLLLIARDVVGDHKWIRQTMGDDTAHPSWVGRLIDDSGHRALRDAWFRLMCVDEYGREWGQPYFAMNPGKGAQVELRPGDQGE